MNKKYFTLTIASLLFCVMHNNRANQNPFFNYNPLLKAHIPKIITVGIKELTKESDHENLKLTAAFVNDAANSYLSAYWINELNGTIGKPNKRSYVEKFDNKILLALAIAVESSSRLFILTKQGKRINTKWDNFFKKHDLEKVGYYGKISLKGLLALGFFLAATGH